MARPRGKIKAVCQNKNCSHYLKEKGKNIVKRGRNTAKHQRYFCLNCNQYFVETKGTPLYQKKLSERKIKQICKELVEKKGIRAVERTLGVHRDTICKLLDDVANHALSMTNHMVHNLGLSTYEADEILTIIKKNKKNLTKKQIYSLNQAKQQLQQLSNGNHCSL
jgi:transposase-like protein